MTSSALSSVFSCCSEVIVEGEGEGEGEDKGEGEGEGEDKGEGEGEGDEQIQENEPWERLKIKIKKIFTIQREHT